MSLEPTLRIHIANATTPIPVYMNRAPDGITGTFIVQRLIGKQDSQLGTSYARIQHDIFGLTYADVKNAAVAVEAAYRTFTGAGTFAVYRGNEIETYESSLNLHRVILDAVLRFEERPQFG